jgi:hypothetical protein
MARVYPVPQHQPWLYHIPLPYDHSTKGAQMTLTLEHCTHYTIGHNPGELDIWTKGQCESCNQDVEEPNRITLLISRARLKLVGPQLLEHIGPPLPELSIDDNNNYCCTACHP